MRLGRESPHLPSFQQFGLWGASTMAELSGPKMRTRHPQRPRHYGLLFSSKEQLASQSLSDFTIERSFTSFCRAYTQLLIVNAYASQETD